MKIYQVTSPPQTMSSLSFFPNPSSETREIRETRKSGVASRVTGGARMPPLFLASARRSRTRSLHTLNLKKKRVQLIDPNRPPSPPPLHTLSHFTPQLPISWNRDLLYLSSESSGFLYLFCSVLFCSKTHASEGLEALKHTYAHRSTENHKYFGKSKFVKNIRFLKKLNVVHLQKKVTPNPEDQTISFNCLGFTYGSRSTKRLRKYHIGAAWQCTML